MTLIPFFSEYPLLAAVVVSLVSAKLVLSVANAAVDLWEKLFRKK